MTHEFENIVTGQQSCDPNENMQKNLGKKQKSCEITMFKCQIPPKRSPKSIFYCAMKKIQELQVLMAMEIQEILAIISMTVLISKLKYEIGLM